MMSNEKLSDNERMKSESHLLRGTITEDLKDRTTGGFTNDNFQLIRFHGMYQQDDRDIRTERSKEKLEPLHTVMLRIRLPGGIITPEQWLGMDTFASSHTQYGSMRVTNRQTLQLHGVLKHDIQPVHRLLHSLGLDSRATAGDVNRNVLCTSNPVESSLHEEAYEWAKKISEHLLPRTHAYAEVWLGKQKLDLQQESEPILGSSYLPRKFKIAVVIPPQNDVDVHANDLSFVAIEEEGRLVGFNVLVGGGLAMTHGDQSTYPRLASDFGFITLEETLDVAAAVVSVQRDWGNRSNRRNARTKYTVDRVGIDTYRSEVQQRAKMTFAPVRPYHFTARGDRIGWTKGVDGKHHLTLYIPSGRILDVPHYPVKTGMAKIAEVHQGDFRLTPNQNVIIAGVAEQDKSMIDNLAHQYHLINDAMTNQRKSSMACVSFPTCPLAMAEAERVLPDISAYVDKLLAKHGISDRSFVFRVTGCPNGCGRAMLAEVGLVGRAIGRYDFYIGGNAEGTRIPRLVNSNQSTEVIMNELDGYLARWAVEAESHESFGDFSVRVGIVKPVLNATIDFYNVVD